MTSAEIASWIARRRAVSLSMVSVERLTGGAINDVFRAHVGSDRMIVKHAPPYVAQVPTIALSQRRMAIEARCYRELAPEGVLGEVGTVEVRAPRYLDFDPSDHVLVIEDCGPIPDLAELITSARPFDPALGTLLGSFIGRLHGVSARTPTLLVELDNRDVQETRARTQYDQVGAWARSLGVADSARLSAQASALGQRLLEPGRCLVMGDLWLRSVLVSGSNLRVIDWELAHAGSPAQDLGHLAAHLWMHAQRATNSGRRLAVEAVFDHFCAAYLSALHACAQDALLTAETVRDATLHAGCEILARIAGPFRTGYLYELLHPADIVVRDAIELASAAILGTATLFPSWPRMLGG